MDAFTVRVDEELNNSAHPSDSGFLSADELRSDNSESDSNRDFQDEASSAENLVPHSTVSVQKFAIFEGPEIIQRLNVFEEVEIGGLITFECQCKGNPLPNSKWYKDDVELENSDRVTIEDSVETDGKIRLIIKNAKKTDEGAYRCKLENQEGVAATTGYLSVAGSSSSPKSEHSMSSPPLLRAITEESNASQDMDEATSTPLDKILTGEYDLTALPYSQYLELMKENNSRNLEQGAPVGDIETLKKNAENGDVIDESKLLIDDAVAMDTNDTQTVDKMAAIGSDLRFEDDFQMSLSSDSTNSFEAEMIPISRVATYGLNLEPVQIIHESIGDQSFEKIAVSDSQILQENIAVEGGKFESERSADDDDDLLAERQLEETVIAGRIGLPSDWEFTHYTPEMEDNEETPSKQNFQVESEVFQTIPQTDTAASLEADKTPSEAEVVAPEDVVLVLADASLNEDLGKERIPLDFLEDSAQFSYVEKVAELKSEVLDASPKIGLELESYEKTAAGTSPEVLQSSVMDSETTPKVESEEVLKLPEDSFVGDTTSESTPDVRHEEEKLTPAVSNYHENGPVENLPLPDEESEHLAAVPLEWPEDRDIILPTTDVPSPASTISPKSSLVNWSAEPIIPDEVKPKEILPRFEISAGDSARHTEASESIPTNPSLVSSSLETALPGWISDVYSLSSSVPRDSTQSKWEPDPVSPEDIEVSVIPDQSLVDWWIEWFQYPWFFYVLLVLSSTMFASAVQLNPALLILVVAIVSLVGFFLFPLQEIKVKQK